jgi:hypothetical protein
MDQKSSSNILLVIHMAVFKINLKHVSRGVGAIYPVQEFSLLRMSLTSYRVETKCREILLLDKRYFKSIDRLFVALS